MFIKTTIYQCKIQFCALFLLDWEKNENPAKDAIKCEKMCLIAVSVYMCVFILQSNPRGVFQLPVLGVFSCRLCRARSVHFISCSFTDSVDPPLSCSASGSSLSGIVTSSYGSLSSLQASSVRSRTLPSRWISLSILWPRLEAHS